MYIFQGKVLKKNSDQGNQKIQFDRLLLIEQLQIRLALRYEDLKLSQKVYTGNFVHKHYEQEIQKTHTVKKNLFLSF